jgi:hypothetical protein
MRFVAGVIALLAFGTAMPAAAQGPKLGQLEIKAYQAIPKTKTAVQLTSDTALSRNLRRQVMVRLARRGNDVGFSGGNVMRMDVSYFDLSAGTGTGTIGGNPSYDGPAANPRPEFPRNRLEQRGALTGSVNPPTLRIILTLYAVNDGKVLWNATTSCPTQAGTAEAAGMAMIDTIFDEADKNRVADAGCPL